MWTSPAKGAGRTFREAANSSHVPSPGASVHWVRDPGFRFAHPGLNSYAASRLKEPSLLTNSKDRSALGLAAVAAETLKLFGGDSTDRSLIWTARRQCRAAARCAHGFVRGLPASLPADLRLHATAPRP